MQKRPERRAQRAKEKLGLLTKSRPLRSNQVRNRQRDHRGNSSGIRGGVLEERRTDKKPGTSESQTDFAKGLKKS